MKREIPCTRAIRRKTESRSQVQVERWEAPKATNSYERLATRLAKILARLSRPGHAERQGRGGIHGHIPEIDDGPVGRSERYGVGW
jgi:hypothetical protein